MAKTIIKWNISFSLSLVFTGLCLFTSCKTEKGKNLPNVVFILADDLGWPQTGAYGSKWYETPNIDRLAGQGISFTHAYAAAAVCSPTRASIMTGKYPARLQLTDFIKGNNREDYSLKQPEWQKYLPLEELTIAEIFKEKGYHTACFGKWHLSQEKKPPESLPFNPDNQGFDEYFVTYKPDNETDPEMDPHNTDTITSLGLDFLRRKGKDPFFLYLSYNAIHDPLVEARAAVEKYRSHPGSQEEQNHPVIAAMIHRMDKGIGRILNELTDLKLEENTLVIFFSDNGGKHSYASQDSFRAGKGWLYEGGIRVPLVMRWPGKITAGKLSDEPIISNDFFPTFNEMLGNSRYPGVDGLSLLNHITSGSDLPYRDLYWHYPHYHRGSGMKPASAILSGNYKLIEWFEGSIAGKGNAYELYNLENDPGERVNLADRMPEIRDSLKLKLEDWRDELKAGMPVGKLVNTVPRSSAPKLISKATGRLYAWR